MIPRKKLDIPAAVSGRTVSNRGVHLLPAAYHGTWMQRANYWVDLLVSMGMSWVVIITDGDSVHEKIGGTTPLRLLLDNGIIPIVRDGTTLFPRSFMNMEAVSRAVPVYEEYGLQPLWIVANEPFDDREWKKDPPDANDIDSFAHVMGLIQARMSRVIENGGIAGFPDGPCYPYNPFAWLDRSQWDNGLAFYAAHNYGKGRPVDYPYDAVTRYGAQLTEEEYREALDDYADDRQWYEEPLDLMNKRRRELVQPGLTAIADDTCWRGWEKVARWAQETLGFVPPMALTEGGWCPRDRAGTGPNTDIRWPHSTPKMVAKKTLAMYDIESPFFSICPWLLADDAMVPAGFVGWPYDSWVGWAYGDDYGPEKPVVDLLKQTTPKEIEPRTAPQVFDVNSYTRDWSWVQHAYGANYRRGSGRLRLSRVQESEGPSSLDVQVVDGGGLPVEGVQFYYLHSGAPPIAEGADDSLPDEWHERGVLGTTDADGRLSFPPSGVPCEPGACLEAVWPAGRGDLLENVGILAGTRNRHLNGVWCLVGEDAPPLPVPPEPEEPEEPEEPVGPPPSPEPDEPPGPPGPPDPPAPPPPPPPPPEPSAEQWTLLQEKLERIEELVSKLVGG